MDDQHFDKSIRNKLENYEDPEFDPTALADLRYRMAVTTVSPWYVQYRTELLVVSALLLFTLFNVFWEAHTDEKRDQSFLNMMDSLNMSQHTITRLQSQLAEISAQASEKNMAEATTLSPAVDKNEISELYDQLQQEADKHHMRFEVYVSKLAEIVESGTRVFASPTKSTSGYLLLVERLEVRSPFSLTPNSFYLNLVDDSTLFHLEKINATVKREKTKGKHLSAATVRELNKHFSRGIGIRLGPVAGLSGIKYQQRPWAANLAGGLLADWILSPSLSLETGALYTFREYNREDALVRQFNKLPGVDESLGKLAKADISSRMLQFPVNAKLYFPLFRQTEGIVSGGYSWLLYLRQDLEYSYHMSNSSGDDELLSLKSSFEQSKPRFYPSMLNFALGTSTLLKNNARLEVSLYYQYGLGKTGIEQVKASTLGLRTAYWFTVR